MKKITLSIIIVSSVYQFAFSSNDSISRVGFHVAYFGESVTHPGYKLGAEYKIWHKGGIRTKKSRKQIPFRHELLVTGSLSNYVHTRNHVGLLIGGEIGYRYIRKKGFKVEATSGIGYLHTFLQGDTYTVNDNNEVKQIKLAGNPNLSFIFSIGIGKDYSLVKNKPWAWNIKTTAFSQYPYGSLFLWHGALELGVTYYLNFKN